MSRIIPACRAWSRTTSSAASRSISSSTTSLAAAAAAPRPPPRRIAVAAAPRRSAPPAPAAPAASAPKPTASASQASFTDFDAVDAHDFDMPGEVIDDYTPSARAAAPPASASASTSRPKPSAPPRSAPVAGMNNVIPSPPLSAFPNDSYRPLPTTAAGDGLGGGLGDAVNDWSTSFAGLSQRPFDKEVADALLRPLSKDDVEVKPDGLLYLPEIKYRRTLNAAFGPGGWGLAPRGETHVDKRIVSREWGLVCLGRLVSVARGEQEYFDESGVPTATEACKSNALMRCCKDLGIASELWDPTFIRQFKAQHCIEVWVEHAKQKTKRKLWRKKDAAKFDYPYKEVGPA